VRNPECDCAECRELAEDLRANAEALSALRDEALLPRRRRAYSGSLSPWLAAAAAAMLWGLTVPGPRHVVPVAEKVGHTETLKIKMLTPDPDVVIYWLIDSKEGD
jgi:hypothetical protein